MLNPGPEELAAKIKELRSQFSARTGSDARWTAILAGYGLTQQDLEEQLTSEFHILSFIDLRFRGLVRVEKMTFPPTTSDHFLPELRKRNVPEPSLAEVSGKIEQILVEQNIDGLLGDWLKTLRAQAHIEQMLPARAGFRCVAMSTKAEMNIPPPGVKPRKLRRVLIAIGTLTSSSISRTVLLSEQ